MAFKCKGCGHVVECNSMPSKCEKCGNRNISMMERVPSVIDPEKKKVMAKMLKDLEK